MTQQAVPDVSLWVSRARIRLLLDQPWFGALLMRLRFESTPDVPTMSVDGTILRYNPTFTASLPEAQLIGLLAHEVMHYALLHVFRRGSRDPQKWNETADYAINPILKNSGTVSAAGGCEPPGNHSRFGER